jgi:hypothetical protein
MKINPDCIRDVLLYLEDNLFITEQNNFSEIPINSLYENLDYTQEDIWYSVYNLNQIRFIEGRITPAGKDKMFFCEIQNITWNGHQFLNTIRPKSIWDATKSKAKQIGGMSLSTLSMLSMSIANAVATNPDFVQSIVDKLK